MVERKIFKIRMIVGLLLCSLLCGACALQSTGGKEETIQIGISQFTEHAALDSAREGFIRALQENGYEDGKNIVIDFQNAQGDIPTAQTIAENFKSQNKDLILAIATSAAQTAYNVTQEIPILITAVTDPQQAGMVKSWEKTGTNVTGTSDLTPVEKQMELIKYILPEKEKIGILYNTSEANSHIQVELAEKAAKELGLIIVTEGITNVNEINQALDVLLNEVEVLYIPTDNTVASAMPLIYNSCMKKSIPIIGGERAHVEAGALITDGIAYDQLGYETGLMAVEVLQGKKPEDMTIEVLKETQLVVNEDTADQLGIELPQDIIEEAEKVQGGGQ
ncbi:MAG: ABC transporter substrate-binding protein [Epulopiscium sp.]|nr:ABC transporter substrate-binding protein [Candidatus Epulonipiscium sp.]